MLTQKQIDDILNASRESEDGPTELARRFEAAAAMDAAVDAERERWRSEIDRLRADRDLEKKWRKDAEDDREELIAAAVAAERERWRAEIEPFLTAAADGSMSRNNSEALAEELLEWMRKA